MDCQFGNRAAVAVGPKLTEIVRRKCRPASADPRPASTLRQASEDGVTQPENGVQRRSPGHRDPQGCRATLLQGIWMRRSPGRAIDWKSRRSSVISDSAPAFLAAATCSQSQTASPRSDGCAQASAVPAAGEYGEGFRQGMDVDLVAAPRRCGHMPLDGFRPGPATPERPTYREMRSIGAVAPRLGVTLGARGRGGVEGPACRAQHRALAGSHLQFGIGLRLRRQFNAPGHHVEHQARAGLQVQTAPHFLWAARFGRLGPW